MVYSMFSEETFVNYNFKRTFSDTMVAFKTYLKLL